MTDPRSFAVRFLGLALLVTLVVTTAGTGLLHGKSRHSEQQCVAWVWSHLAKDASPVPARLAHGTREITLVPVLDPEDAPTFRVQNICIRGPPSR